MNIGCMEMVRKIVDERLREREQHIIIPSRHWGKAVMTAMLADEEKQAQEETKPTLTPEQAEAVKGVVKARLSHCPDVLDAIDSLVAPVKADWTPKVGERVWWDGVRVYFSGIGNKQEYKAGWYTLDRDPSWEADYPYSFSGTFAWTTLEHISPTPVKTVPVAPTWKVGDWAYHRCGEIGKIHAFTGTKHAEYHEMNQLDRFPVVVSLADLRPLTPSDWTREIGGVKVRAYETHDSGIKILYPTSRDPRNNNGNSYSPECAPVARELCRLANIPIMPYSLNQGKYDPPE